MKLIARCDVLVLRPKWPFHLSRGQKIKMGVLPLNNLELSIFYVVLINCPRHPDEAFTNGLFLKAAQLLLALVNYVEYTKRCSRLDHCWI